MWWTVRLRRWTAALAPPQPTLSPCSGELLVKKGRHRRFEEARSLKRAIEVVAQPCPECGADPEDDHASWCMYEAEELDEDGDEATDPLA